MRKWPAIDLMELRTKGGSERWNEYLTKCHKTWDLTGLAQTRYRIQAGMDDLAKQKLNTPEICLWFTRLERSIWKTAQKIVREKYPNPCDDPLKARNFLHAQAEKRKRDLELDKFLRDSSY